MGHESCERRCEHEVKHCSHCGVVYCAKCDKEWFENNISYNVVPWSSWKTGVDCTSDTNNCKHN